MPNIYKRDATKWRFNNGCLLETRRRRIFSRLTYFCRIPAFEELKLTGGWAGYYDCNRLDNNAVVGKHPKYENVYMASGFTGRGLMQAPGIGRALTELITTGSYQTIDISDFAVERVLGKSARPEPYVL